MNLYLQYDSVRRATCMQSSTLGVIGTLYVMLSNLSVAEGSLGAVMLGHTSSPVVEPADAIIKEIQETKLRRDYNLPKKYQHITADVHR